MVETEEFELVPSSPIKRLDKRIKKLEKFDTSSDTKKLTEHIMDLVASNQNIVETMINSNNELKKEMFRLPEKMEEFMDEMKDSFRILKSPNISDMPIDSLDALLRKMNQLIEQNRKHLDVNKASLDHLNEINKRLKRIYLHNTFVSRKVDIEKI